MSDSFRRYKKKGFFVTVCIEHLNIWFKKLIVKNKRSAIDTTSYNTGHWTVPAVLRHSSEHNVHTMLQTSQHETHSQKWKVNHLDVIVQYRSVNCACGIATQFWSILCIWFYRHLKCLSGDVNVLTAACRNTQISFSLTSHTSWKVLFYDFELWWRCCFQ